MKSLTTNMKKYRIFSCVVDIANQLLTRHSPFAPLGRLINEQRSLHHSQSVCRLWEFFRIMAAKTLKNPYNLQTVTFKLF